MIVQRWVAGRCSVPRGIPVVAGHGSDGASGSLLFVGCGG